MTMTFPPWRLAAVLLGFLLASPALSGCKARAGPDSGFLSHPERMIGESEVYPFHREWFAEGWNAPRYKTIVIAPVNTNYLDDPNGWAKTNLKGHRIAEDTANLAQFTRVAFEKAFREDPKHRFEVPPEPRDDSLIFELALVEVVPNKATLGALGLAATVLAPVGVGIAAKEGAKGIVGIEGRIRAARNGEVVAMFADRETGKFGPINLRRATWYGHAHKIIEEWAEQWVAIANLQPGDKVDDTRTWTLLPW